MKTLLITFIAIAIFCSCMKNKDNSPVRISSLIDEYTEVVEGDSASFQNFLENILAEYGLAGESKQDLCTLHDWWIDLPEQENSTDFFLSNAEDIYNVNMLMSSVYSDCEIFARGNIIDEEPLVASEEIIDAFKKTDLSMLKSDELKEHGQKYIDGMQWCINNPEKWDDNHNPNGFYYELYDIETQKHFMKIVGQDEVSNYYKEVDSLLLPYMEIQKEIAQVDEPGDIDYDRVKSKKFIKLLSEIQKAKTFDDQCGIALACASKYSTNFGLWTIRLLATLMNSGKYSLFLERMWIMWRSYSQESFGGMSRDSIIQNHAYDRMRKTAYQAIFNHVAQAPDDQMAKISAIMTCTYPSISRFGQFEFGNDALLWKVRFFPDYYENMQE